MKSAPQRSIIPDVIADWAEATSTPIYVPSPSLTQHIGETSAIWHGVYDIAPHRRAACFLDAPGGIRARTGGESAADFPELAFPCMSANIAEYHTLVARGRERMARHSAVICGLCRDVATSLPTTIWPGTLGGNVSTMRLGRVRKRFRRQHARNLGQWAESTSGVVVISERLAQPRYRGMLRKN